MKAQQPHLDITFPVRTGKSAVGASYKKALGHLRTEHKMAAAVKIAGIPTRPAPMEKKAQYVAFVQRGALFAQKGGAVGAQSL